jgi:DNA-3-methyladenine glycosylase II
MSRRAAGLRLDALGPFSLPAAVSFMRGFAPATYEAQATDRLSFAFVAEDGWVPTAVQIRSGDRGVVVDVVGPPRDGLREQVARMLSLDVDGREFLAVGDRDPGSVHSRPNSY